MAAPAGIGFLQHRIGRCQQKTPSSGEPLEGIHIEKAVFRLERRGENKYFGRRSDAGAVPGEKGVADGHLAKAVHVFAGVRPFGDKMRIGLIVGIQDDLEAFSGEVRQRVAIVPAVDVVPAVR